MKSLAFLPPGSARCRAPFSHQKFSLYVKSMNHYYMIHVVFGELITTAKYGAFYLFDSFEMYLPLFFLFLKKKRVYKQCSGGLKWGFENMYVYHQLEKKYSLIKNIFGPLTKTTAWSKCFRKPIGFPKTFSAS